MRDYLESIHWNKQPPAPPLPEEVAAKTGEKYRQAYQVLTGREAMNWLDIVLLLIVAVSVLEQLSARGFRARSSDLASVVAGIAAGRVVLWNGGDIFAAVCQFADWRRTWRIFSGVCVSVSGWASSSDWIVGKFLRVTGLSIVDHLLGAVFGAARGMLMAVALITGGHGIRAGRRNRPRR